MTYEIHDELTAMKVDQHSPRQQREGWVILLSDFYAASYLRILNTHRTFTH